MSGSTLLPCCCAKGLGHRGADIQHGIWMNIGQVGRSSYVGSELWKSTMKRRGQLTDIFGE